MAKNPEQDELAKIEQVEAEVVPEQPTAEKAKVILEKKPEAVLERTEAVPVIDSQIAKNETDMAEVVSIPGCAAGEDTLELPKDADSGRLSDLLGDAEEELAKIDEITPLEENGIKDGSWQLKPVQAEPAAQPCADATEKEETGKLGTRATHPIAVIGDDTAEMLSAFPWKYEKAVRYAASIDDGHDLLIALNDMKESFAKSDYKALRGFVEAINHVYKGAVPDDLKDVIACIEKYAGKLESVLEK
jgi:hypothetical protein